MKIRSTAATLAGLFLTSLSALASSPSFKLGEQVEFTEAQDASAAVSVGGGMFISASDENNTLRLYAVMGGTPVKEGMPIALGFKPKSNNTYREYDIEGAARIGDTVYWIGSHGRNNKGEVKEERRVLFATTISGTGKNATAMLDSGSPYKGLIDDLQSAPLSELNLAKAIGTKETDLTLAPKESGALNIESLCADGTKLLIGFRNPLIDQAGKKCALIIPLLNPKDTVQTEGKASLGKPIFVDLGGLGVRDMVKCNSGFLIIAGSHADRFTAGVEKSKIYFWEGDTTHAPEDLQVDFEDLNPEAIIDADGDGKRFLVLSDDGKRVVDGVKNNDLPAKKQSFRGVWLERK